MVVKITQLPYYNHTFDNNERNVLADFHKWFSSLISLCYNHVQLMKPSHYKVFDASLLN